MSVGKYCNREVVIAERETEVREAARLMRRHHVGDLIVVERRGPESIPIGVVTDRDLVVEVLAQDVPVHAVILGDVMSPELVTARESDALSDTLRRMASLGIRRLPVVNDHGGLVGILTADDILELFAEAMANLASLVGREIEKETEQRD